MVYVLIFLFLLTIGSACASDDSYTVRHIADPCRTRNVLSGRFFTDPNSGHLCAALLDTNEVEGGELVVIDLTDGSGQSYLCPAGQGGWAMLEVSGERLMLGTFYDGQFIEFDLRERKFVKHAGLKGEDYIWEFALGSDGRLYGGTYPGGKLISLDLDTFKVYDCGAPTPPNMYLRNLSTLPDGRIYCNFGMEKKTQRIYDPKTGEFSEVPAQLEGVQKGVSWNGYFFSADKAFEGPDLSMIKERPVPGADGEWPLKVEVQASNSKTLVLWRGSEIFAINKGESELSLVCPTDIKGGRLLDARDGKVLGIRGQDYFVLEKDKPLTLTRIPLTPAPRDTLFLQASPSGKLWGGPGIGQTLFSLDPTTGEFSNTATVCNSGGEVYDVCFVGSDIYAVSYAGGDIIRYKPDEPWDQLGNVNPKTLESLGAKGYIRPVAGAFKSADNKVYSGWMADYGTYGGALSITDPETAETSIIENPLGEVTVCGAAGDEKFIYIASGITANGLPNKPDAEPEFAVMDKESKQIIYKKEFPGKVEVRIIGVCSELGKVVAGAGMTLEIFDIAKKEFESALPADLPQITCYNSFLTGSNLYYSFMDRVILLDLASMEWKELAKAPATIRNVAMISDKIYVSCGKSVYEIVPAEK